MAQERKGFMCYRSFRDAINELPIEERLEVYESIVDYALDKIEPETAKMSGAVRMAWKLIKPTLDADWTRWKNGCQGGAPVGNQNARKQPKNNRETTEKQPKNNQKQPTVYQDSRIKIEDSRLEIVDNSKNNISRKNIEKEFLSEVEVDFREVVEEWFAYKRERGEQYKSKRAMQHFVTQLRTLSKNSRKEAEAIIGRSMANNWAGIFEQNKTSNNDQRNNSTANTYRPSFSDYGEDTI